MSTIDLGAFRATPLETDPFDYLVVPHFVPPEKLTGIIEDFPSVPGPGSHPPSLLKIKGAFADLLSEMDAEPFRRAVEEKFSLDLADRRPCSRSAASAARKTAAFTRIQRPRSSRSSSISTRSGRKRAAG